MDPISVIFVLSDGLLDESEAGATMIKACEACKKMDLNISWVREKEIRKKELKKTDFVVFENLEGKDFSDIIKKKMGTKFELDDCSLPRVNIQGVPSLSSRTSQMDREITSKIMLPNNINSKMLDFRGPWCVLTCLEAGKKIPNFQWPIHNVAMYDCIVTCSNLDKLKKAAIKEKVQSMGGYYTDKLEEHTTHLITDSVKSAKYIKAVEINVKVMVPDWIDAVWNANQEEAVHCDEERFDKFKCPPLYNLIICTTGIMISKEKEKVKQMVIDNGGNFTGALRLKATDVLICEGSAGTMSDKYREARKTENIKCVTLQWLYACIKKGYCVPHEPFAPKKETSTPKKNEHIDPNFSTLSAINQNLCERSCVDESFLPKGTFEKTSSSTNGIKRKVFTESDNLIEQIDIKRIKRNGQFLDGCSVYLVGFKGEQREKLCKIINASGATRCDDMSDRVSHVIVGDTEAHELKVIRSKSYCSSLVTLHWLLDSLEKKKPCHEEPYLVSAEGDNADFRSPLGKKGLSLLRSNRTITEVDLTLSQKEIDNQQKDLATEQEQEIMKRYLVPDATEEDTLANLLKNANYDSNQLGAAHFQDPTPSDTGTQSTLTTSQEESQSTDIFQGKNFLLTCFEDELMDDLKRFIEDACGTTIENYKDGAYVVAPAFISEPLKFDQAITINDIWLYDSVAEQELVQINYYHRPLLVTSNAVLEDCVVTISGYSGYERQFLHTLITHLGGIPQELFSRIERAERNVLRSTHLVSSAPSGNKYQAALKWKLPAVNKDWLVSSARAGRKLPENQFPVTETGSQDESNLMHIKAPVDSNKENITLDITSNKTDINKTLKDSAGSDSTKNTLNTSPRTTPYTTSHNLEPQDVMNAVASTSSNKKSENLELETSPGSSSSSRHAVVGVCKTPKGPNDDDSFTIPSAKRLSLSRKDQKTPGSKDTFKTPDRRLGEEVCSQVTPIDKIMKEVRLTNLLGTPESPQLAKSPWDVDTPETPYGCYIDPNPSRSLKKEMLRFLNQFPEQKTPRPRRISTPLSELKRRLWDKIGSCSQSENQEDTQNYNQEEEHETEKESNTQTELVNTKLQQLEDMMAATGGSASKSRRFSKSAQAVPEHVSEVNLRESQPCTIQWDFGKDTQEEPSPKSPVFMISGINDNEERQEIVVKLEQLGGTVINSSAYDPSSTHLLCPKPARNEKTLSCMAAGKWILHTNYVDACTKAGKFLDEEDYEFGNPNSIGKISIELDRDMELRMQAIHFWRSEVARTGRGAFHDMRALVVAEKKHSLISVIKAGGGTTIDVQPPFHEVVHATHCLIEPKSAVNFALYEPLAKQGIYCVNTVYISDFLTRKNRDIKDSVLPFFQKYFR